jgi:hypothetical protein
MSKSAKLINAMRNNPAGDWSIEDIKRVCGQIGWRCLPPSGGSHWKIVIPGREAILTIPARRPIKPIYVRQLVAMIDEVTGNETEL